MKKVGRLLLYIVLSICVVYFAISNLNNWGNVRTTVDFIKHGSEKDVVEYSKKIESDFKKSLEQDQTTSEEKSNTNQEETSENKKEDTKKKEDKEDNNKKDEEKNTETKNEEEKEYKNITELSKDYPMGVVFYSMTMSRGELQIETLCVSIIYGMFLGIVLFMFSIKNPTNIKEVGIMYIIALISAIVSMELIQMLTLILAYGTIYFVKIEIQYLAIITAVFLVILAMKKIIKKDEEKMKEIKAEFKEKIKSKKKDRK